MVVSESVAYATLTEPDENAVSTLVNMWRIVELPNGWPEHWVKSRA